MHVPMKRRLQTAAVLAWALLIPLSLALFLYLWYALWLIIVSDADIG